MHPLVSRSLQTTAALFAFCLAPGIHASNAATAPDALLQVDLNRAAIVERVVSAWAKEVPAGQLSSFKDKLSELRADQLLAANLSGSLDGVLEVMNSHEKASALLNAKLSPADNSKALGDVAADVVYTPITPCRFLDTRGANSPVFAGGIYTAGQTRTYQVTGNCGVPAGATAVVTQIIMITPPGAGDIEVLPQGGTFGGTVAMVFQQGVFSSVSLVARLNQTNGQFAAQVRGQGGHVAMDVMGYFRAPSAVNGNLLTATYRLPQSCSNDQVPKFNTSSGLWVCAADNAGTGGGSGTVSSVATGSGLTGGPITTAGTIGLAATQLLPTTACAANQIAAWNGTSWVCSNPASGTVTSVATGSGLTGGPINASGTIALTATQLLPTTACSVNQVAKWNGSAWICATDLLGSTGSNGTVTSVSTGPGLAGGPITGAGTITLAASQLLPTTACAVGQVSKWVAPGEWACAADNAGAGTVTSVATGAGLAGGPISASGTISLAATQLMPTTACAANQIPKWNGTAWACAADAAGAGTVTSVATGSGLTGGPISASGTIGLATTQLLPTTACASNQVPQWNGSAWACATISTGTNAWTQGGNAFGAAGVIGTTDAQNLTVQSGGSQISVVATGGNGLRIVQSTGTFSNAPNVTNGSSTNAATTQGAVVAGGGRTGANCFDPATAASNRACNNAASAVFATIGGGQANVATAESATVAGGVSNGARAFGNLNVALGSGATVGGGENNTANSLGATVGGGFLNFATGNDATVAGGESNTADGARATVGGGTLNLALGINATVGGGASNSATNETATVSGGFQNTASAIDSTVMGGSNNTASGQRATVGGGSENTASGNGSWAGGFGATTQLGATVHHGAFVWADSAANAATPAPFSSSASDQFAVRARGGFVFKVGAAASANDSAPGCSIAPSGSPSLICTSDRNAKEAFRKITARDVLSKVIAMPLVSWQYKGSGNRHLSPMAQDFWQAFGLGTDDKHIASSDVAGVALAAIQGMNQKLNDEVATLKAKNATLERELAAIKRKLGL
jgi:trimeric autotransporter adhesin